MKEIIIKLYFENKMKQVDIAKQLNISKYKVSRTLSKDEQYQKEKEKHKEKTKNIYQKKEKENLL